MGATVRGLAITAFVAATLSGVPSFSIAPTLAGANVSHAPSPADATQAFGRWLGATYGSVQGYWACPAGQTYGQRIACLAEVRVGHVWHMTSATALLSGSHVIFPEEL
jgi:hypothetical protein